MEPPSSTQSQAQPGEKKAGGILRWIFGTPHGCMLTVLGCMLLLCALPWITFYLSAFQEDTEEWSPEKAFRLSVMDPIPEGVTHIRMVGARDSMVSVLVIMFDENPATFPVILEKWLLHPIAKEEQANCEALNFSDCPRFDGADYFEDVPQDNSNLALAIKANPSRTKVYFALRGIEPHS